MSNPFNPSTPQGEPQDPAPEGSARPTPPNYEAYRYPSGGAESTPPTPPAPPSEPGYGGYSAYGSPASDPGYGGSGAASTWAVDEKKNGVSPWALGLGILGLIMGLSILATGIAFVVGLIGLIVGLVALVRGRRINGPGRRTGMAVVGLVLSVITIGLSIVFWVVFGVIMADTGMMDCINITDSTERQECVERSIDTWLNQ